MTQARGTTFRKLWWVPPVCLGVAWALSQVPLVKQLAWKTLDWRTAYRVAFQPPPDPRIAIVLYEDSTHNANPALQWPPDRAVHAELITMMALGKPKVITYDVILDASRKGEGDDQMAVAVLKASLNGVKMVSAGVTNSEPGAEALDEGPTRPLTNVEGDTSRLLGDEHALKPFPQLRALSRYGFADTPHGPDGVQREVPAVVRVGREVYPSLALQTLMAYFDVPPEKVRVRLGDAVYLPTESREWRIPINDSGRVLLNYRYDQGDWGTDFTTYSCLEVLLKSSMHYVDKNPLAPKPPAFDGRIVLLGQVVTGMADAGSTPRGGNSPLVLVHANLINNVLREDFARRVPDGLVFLLVLGLSYAGLIWVADRSVLQLCAGTVLLLLSYTSAGVWLWVWKSWWLALEWPLIGLGLLQFVVVSHRIAEEQRAKREIKSMFGSYVSPVVVERMVKSGERPHLGGMEEEITAYFSDIEGFSTFSEKLPPERLVELMNEYLTACTDTVQEEGGTLDKYIGDAVVAMFGAPIPLADHAYRACVATLRVQQRLRELRAKWQAEGDKWPEIVGQMRTRIGLNSGLAVVGNMGSRTRFNYTMMGDNVNLAARMESGAKIFGVYAMCTEMTKAACEQHGGDRILFRPLGRIVVKGRTSAVSIYELAGAGESVDAQQRECVAIFSRALEKYYARDWTGAAALFTKSAGLECNVLRESPDGSRNPSGFYLGLVEQFRANPPPPNWNGDYVMGEK